MADITVTLPQHMSKGSDSVFIGSDADGGEYYSNNNVGFAYARYDVSDLGLEDEGLSDLKRLFIISMDETFKGELEGYKKKSNTDDLLKFYYTEDGEKYYSELQVGVNDGQVYMFIAFCKSNNETKFVGKFNTLFKSIKYN